MFQTRLQHPAAAERGHFPGVSVRLSTALRAVTLGALVTVESVYRLRQSTSPACVLAAPESKGFWSGLSGFRGQSTREMEPGQL